MATMPNRMQLHWSEIQLFLKNEWPKLTGFDLEEIDGEYDRLIHKVKELYGGGDEIQQEAAIKGKIQRFLNELERPVF
jgi:uncharacterized protein YjbJ (UPF0337 family)